jgi:predicted RNase H-like HicB family nuclease
MKTIQVKNLVWKEGKKYVAQCLDFEVSSFGSTKKKAVENLKEALELFFEDYKFPTHKSSVKFPEIVNSKISYAQVSSR